MPGGQPEPPDASQGPGREAWQRLEGEVRNAVKLLDFALERGHRVPPETTRKVREAERELVEAARTQSLFDPAIRSEFESAFRRLAELSKPVSPDTLWATSQWRPDGTRRARSEAHAWGRRLWAITCGTLLFILFAENLDRLVFASTRVDFFTEGALIAEDSALWSGLNTVLAALLPFAYGALGACAFLLRSCHQALHERTFDTKRIPEYLNRLLLGVVSGGAVMLFFEELTTAEVHLGGAALAFIAGYNTDFLFTTLERVAGAILPKVRPQSPAPAPAPSTQPTPRGPDAEAPDES